MGQVHGPDGPAVAGAGAGLWLPESNGIHMMFMRFPIDAVFVGRPRPATRWRAAGPVAVHRGLRAWTGLVPLVRGAHGVLELPVGTIDATGDAGRRPIAIGQRGDAAAVHPLVQSPVQGSGA